MAQHEMDSPAGSVMRALIAASSAKRMGTPGEIVSAAAFLLGPDSSFISGSDLLVDGGVVAAIGAGRQTTPDIQ